MMSSLWKKGSLIFILDDGLTYRKWSSKKNEFPNDFIFRILREKNGGHGQWLEYLIRDLEEANLVEREPDVSKFIKAINKIQTRSRER
jgi:hypothetical protein